MHTPSLPRVIFVCFALFYGWKVSGSEVQGDNAGGQPQLMNPDFVQITTANDRDLNDFSVNDKTKYSLSQDGYVFWYTLADNAICTKCEYGGNVLWEYDSEAENKDFPRALSFHSDLFMVFVQFQSVIHMYAFREHKFALLSEHNPDGFSASDVSFVLQKDSDPSNPNVYETKLPGHNQGYQFEYEFKDGTKFVEVKYRGSSVWKHDSEDSDGKYPRYIHTVLYTKMIIIDFEVFYLVYQCSADGCFLLSRSSLYGFSENDLKFKGVDSSGNAANELDASKYDLVKYPDGFTYLFTFRDSDCTEITYKGEPVWRQEVPGASPKSLYVNLSVYILMLDAGQSFSVYMYIAGWREIFKYQPSIGQQEEEQEAEKPEQIELSTAEESRSLRGPPEESEEPETSEQPATAPSDDLKRENKKEQTSNKMRVGKYVLIGSAGVVVAAVCGLSVWYLMKRRSVKSLPN